MERFAWNVKTLVAPYETAGFANPSWDDAAKRALTGFASLRCSLPETNGRWSDVIATNCAAAIQAGCKDPMIAYLAVRFPVNEALDGKAVADALCQVAAEMKQTTYPPVRKFYAVRRATEQVFRAYGPSADRRTIEELGGVVTLACEAIKDSTIPIQEAYEVACETLESYAGLKDPGTYLRVYQRIEKPMFDKWPDDYRPWLVKGMAYVRLAWIHRGGGYANTVSEDGWKNFAENLAVAEKALERAWGLDQKDATVPIRMMRVELGQGKGRDRLELWFNRAMKIDTNCYDACDSKLFYLEPKWHGSAPILLAFGRQCVESKQWGGRVPLILLNAHEAVAGYLEGEEKTNYWKQSEVWLDIEAAFDRFFELNPGATDWYQSYAWYARRSERWNKVRELLPTLGEINYATFGGKDQYDEMVRLANANADKTPVDRLTIEIELNRLSARLANKIDLGAETEEALTEEINAFDALLAKYPDAPVEQRAGILMGKAMFFLEVLKAPAKARESILRVKQQFPESLAGRSADEMLAMISKMEQVRKIQEALVAGQPFPDFEATDLAGNPLSVASRKGKVVLIDFWATWCVPCIAELPNTMEVYSKYHDQGLEIIGISLDEERDELDTFLKRRQLPWPQHFDGKAWNSPLVRKYGIDSIPATFLLDRDGKILAKDLRGEALGEAVAKALAK